jgi:hypothetical protein
VLSFGTAGCNLACKFCQNWDISKSREIDTLADAASPQALAAVAERAGCRSVLPPDLRRSSGRRARHPALPAPRDRRVVRDHHAADSRAQ